jgi:hypothetical protein
VHREGLWQAVLNVEAHAFAFGDLNRRAGDAAVEPPAVHGATWNQFGAHVLDANVEHLHPVLEPPRHVRHVGTHNGDDPWTELVRRHRSSKLRGSRRRWLWRRRRVYVLCISGLRGSGARNGRHATQKRTSAGLHTNLELRNEND